jgi:hypothetical protein
MQNLWIEKQINKNITRRVFKYYELGVLGCGRDSKPFLDLTPIVQFPDNNSEIIVELTKNFLSIPSLTYNAGAIIPKSLNGNKNIITHYYNFIENYVDQNRLNQFKSIDDFDGYLIKRFNCENWKNMLVLRYSDSWHTKSLDICKWNQNVNIPKFKKWVESLRHNIFDQIGRIIVYDSNINRPVFMHRDFPYRQHNSHFINFQFSGSTNVAYVYDEVKKEKIYVDTPCYTFNECDLHGVDSCAESRFTVRIDGVFKPHICELLNLNNSNIWDESSATFSKIKDIKVFEPIFED